MDLIQASKIDSENLVTQSLSEKHFFLTIFVSFVFHLLLTESLPEFLINARPRDAREKDARPRDAKERDARPRDAREKDARPRDARERDARPRDARER